MAAESPEEEEFPGKQCEPAQKQCERQPPHAQRTEQHQGRRRGASLALLVPRSPPRHRFFTTSASFQKNGRQGTSAESPLMPT